MRRIASLVLYIALAAAAFAQDSGGRFLRVFPLDERAPYQIPVAVREGVTTLLFPVPPQNYAAARIAFVEAGQQVPDFSSDERIDFVLITHRGASYCTVRALRSNARDTLSVFLDGKVYQLFLRADDAHPLYTVQFIAGTTASQRRAEPVSPDRLVDCLTKAKAYPVLAKYYPERLDDVTRVRPARVISYSDFRVLLDEVFRFDAEDTLVFRILLENQTGREIYYKPQQLSVRVADKLYNASIVDAAGVMPPRSVVPAYFAITGSPDGGRAELDPARNDFTVLVPRVFPPEPTPLPVPAEPTIDTQAPPLAPAPAQAVSPQSPSQSGVFRPARTK
ncbi:MAG: hypothetical protein PW734_11060 [Verrucomicrobium sp.]|nr:hypothetical protein [Verrucomicrobium sp.]